MKLLTTSEKSCYQLCPRKHYYQYYLLMRSVWKTESLRFGSLWHRGQEAWWGASKMPLQCAFSAMNQPDPRSGKPDPVQLIIAQELMELYDERWGNEPYEVLGVEQQFECPMLNPETGAASRTFRRAGKIDVIVRDARDGRVLVVEHKTSSEDITPGNDYWKMLQLNSQVSDYFVGGKSLGHDIVGCLYDVVAKPKLRPLLATPPELRKYTKATKTEPSRPYAGQRDTDETLDEFRVRLRAHIRENPAQWLQRGLVSRLEEDENDAAFDTWQLAQQIRESERLGRHPRNTNGCKAYFKICEYFGVCTRTESLDDETLFRKAETAHEELVP
jgi:PD-(D/E)XK nuclease superfamily